MADGGVSESAFELGLVGVSEGLAMLIIHRSGIGNFAQFACQTAIVGVVLSLLYPELSTALADTLGTAPGPAISEPRPEIERLPTVLVETAMGWRTTTHPISSAPARMTEAKKSTRPIADGCPQHAEFTDPCRFSDGNARQSVPIDRGQSKNTRRQIQIQPPQNDRELPAPAGQKGEIARRNPGVGGLDNPRGLINPVVRSNLSSSVFFGTDREPFSRDDPASAFGSGPVSGRRLLRGVSTITFPRNRKIGERPHSKLTSCGWFQKIFGCGAQNHEVHMTVRETHRFEENEKSNWQDRITDDAAEKRTRHAQIFFHGANTGFGSALLLAAQVHNDTRPGSVSFLFSFPAGDEKLDPRNYIISVDSVVDSARACGEFLAEVLQHPAFDKVHLIPYSIGSSLFGRCSKEAIRLVGGPGSTAARKLIGRSVFLVAPDHETSKFTEETLPLTKEIGAIVVLYGNCGDQWLSASQLARKSQEPRLGMGCESIFKDPGMESVDVTGYEVGNLGHDLLSLKIVLDDISAASEGVPPHGDRRQRHLVPRYSPQGLPYFQTR